jgi:phosphoribosyl 1,2-cyclic phosphodiesterase
MQVRFHGVRGSLASPSVATNSVGGNTSCVEVTAGDHRLVFDAGTGIRALGDELLQEGKTHTVVLLSHLHWDHIQGLPFFAPLYVPGNRVDVMSGPNGFMSLRDALKKQMSPPFFPVSIDQVATQLCVRDLGPAERFNIGDVRVSTARLNHPDPVYGYRIDFAGRSVVYATDTEHYSCVDPHLRRLAEGADLLVYDAQYTPEEYNGEEGPSKVGWGHSTYEAAATLARSAGVKQLVLFHHDPRRSDEDVGHIERRCRALFPVTTAAREGMEIRLDGAGRAGERDAA